MVVLLVLLTFAAFILLGWYVEVRRRQSLTLVEPAGEVSGDLFLHPGHSWVRRSAGGTVTAGVSDFATNFAGRIQRVDLPAEGSRLRQGAPAWTLESERGRRLTQVMPVDGKILAINRDLITNPKLVQESPYQRGWLVLIRPERLLNSLRNLLQPGMARSWSDGARRAISLRLTPALGARALDGGEWVTGFGDLLPDEEWEAARRELFPQAEPRERNHE